MDEQNTQPNVLILVREAQAGDSQAFGALYDVYAQRIFKFIRIRVQNSALAEDLLQEVFIKAWRAMPKFKLDNINFSAWLYRIARNTIADYFRVIYRKPEPVELTEELGLSAGRSLAEDTDNKLSAERVRQAFQHLAPQYKEVLELRFVQDFTLQETADVLGKTNLAVRLLQHRALKKLREILD